MFSRITRHPRRSAAFGALALGAVVAGCLAIPAANADQTPDNSLATTTPIKHVVVIFDENVSFDHYFATYPNAKNTDGTPFLASPSTPTDINTEQKAGLLDGSSNPNEIQPQRLTPGEALTPSQNHGYKAEQLAENSGAMNKFVENTQSSTVTPSGTTYSRNGIVMDYYDGNTVTAEWNYAQNYAMSDNSWDTNYGPSSVGALNLVSGQTGGVTSYVANSPYSSPVVASGDAGGVAGSTTDGTVIGDPDPYWDDCANKSSGNTLASLSGKNIGDLLNEKHVTWGWFQGGFRPTKPSDGTDSSYATCGDTSFNVGNNSVNDYSAHHEPFEYYQSTANVHHVAPSSVSLVGHDEAGVNHQYDMSDFDSALADGYLPAVSFLKPPAAEDAHPGNSTPLDEQKFLVKEIDAIQQSKYWPSTAIVIAYDDSDGWYDHVAPVIQHASNDSANDSAICTSAATGGDPSVEIDTDRCGPSQRLPMLVISPYAKQDYVDHTETNQASVLQFIEDNWSTGRIGDGSFDASAGSIDGMFDWNQPQQREVLLDSNGAVLATPAVKVPASTGDTSSPAPTVTVTAQPGTVATATGLSANGATQRYGSTGIHLSAQVTGGTAPVGGTVAFLDGGKTLATVPLANGGAGYTLPKTLAVGTHQISAKFSSSAASSSDSVSGALKVTVAKAVSTTALSYSKGRVTVSVKAPGVSISGTAKVFDGSKLVKTAKLTKGKASFAVKLKKGTHRLHASFATTKTVAGSTSATVTVKIAK